MVKTSCLTKRKFKDSEEIEITDIVLVTLFCFLQGYGTRRL